MLFKGEVIKLTDKAKERLQEIVQQSEGKVLGVRVGVKNGGCAGMSYTLQYVESVDPKDEKVELNGASLFIEPKAVLFLLGTEMDFVEDKLSSQFVFNNPNQLSACGCGESVQLQEAKVI